MRSARPLPLYRPTHTDGIMAIVYFHALARLGLEGLVIAEPTAHFISLGSFGDATKVIDLDYCRAHDIPVMRREVGGGAVLLGPGQVFYNLVLRRDTDRIPRAIAAAYRQLSQAPIAVFDDLGVPVRYQPINDLVTATGRKIAGQGAGDIEDCFCYVGSVLNTFDVALMCRALKLPSETLRTQVLHAMDSNMTWLARELGHAVESETIAQRLSIRFADVVAPLEPAPLPDTVVTLAHELAQELTSEEILNLDAGRRYDKIKIREGVYIPLE